MSEHEDKEFAAFLRRHGDVSRAYRRLKCDAPPADIDARMAQHARAVLPPARSRLKDMDRPVAAKPSWFAPFSLAASVLLSAAVLMAIAIDPHVRGAADAPVKLVRVGAGRDDRAEFVRPAPASRAAERESHHIVPRLIEPRRLYSTDPPGSHPPVVPEALPPMPVEVIRKDPREWRARIEQLRREGHAEQADAEWQAFLKVYPQAH
jgi:hypothetical protein